MGSARLDTPAAPAPWAQPLAAALETVGSSPAGLSTAEARRRLAAQPRPPHQRASWVHVLGVQFRSPIVLVLVAATLISMLVGDVTDGAIILAIVVASGVLGFVQDFRAGRDVAALMALVQVSATVQRDGRPSLVPVAQVVLGDVVELVAGSIVPADCRLLTATGLSIDESVLTGESFPVDKDAAAPVPTAAALADRTNLVHFGTHVASGTGTAIVVAVGVDTELGRVKSDLSGAEPVTSYERGIARFGYLLVRMMLTLTGFIFVVNAAFGRPLLESLLFSLALAVGLTPQMLPAIVTLSLSTGARLMARSRVIVKRLEVIEDFGSMAILCTDKTGTITQGAPNLDLAIDLSGTESELVLRLAALNAGLQTGYPNPVDAAILARQTPPAAVGALGEVPYDFSRKRLSVLAEVDGRQTLVTKGAFPGVLGCCAFAHTAAGDVPMAQARAGAQQRFEALSGEGYRVLGLATKEMSRDAGHLGPAEETELTLQGLLCFHDPVKDTAAQAIAQLAELGISLRMVTGDHVLAARAAAEDVGLDVTRILTGAEIAAMDDAELARASPDVAVFAEVEPHAKARIVRALRFAGTGVGYLGDGINDAPPLHAADVGISVDTAVDVAKEAAAVVLLEKRLSVVIDGVRLGRRTFANTRKYTRLTTSANLGNMLSMAVASLFLPFLPLLPMQILLLNFLSDIPSLAIAEDQVDSEQVVRPASWDLREMRGFMLVFGAVSTVFDLALFAVLLWGLQTTAVEFRSAWFIESTISELLVLFSLRTARPMLSSAPAPLLVWLSLGVGLTVAAIPFLPPLASALGLAPPSGATLLVIAVITAAYLATNELVKRFYHRTPTARTAS